MRVRIWPGVIATICPVSGPELARRAPVVEGEEEDREPEPEGHEDADDRVLLRGPGPADADDEGREDGACDRSADDVEADEQGEGGAGEGELGDPVNGERDVPGHDEDADETSDDAEEGGGDEGIGEQGDEFPVVLEGEQAGDDLGDRHQIDPRSVSVTAGASAWTSPRWWT